MTILQRFVLLCLCLLLACCAKPVETPMVSLDPKEIAKLDVAKTTDQLVVVGAKGGSKAVVFFFEKEGDTWKKVFQTDGFVGKNGIGKTMEGDGKTPTGVFSFTKAFGIAKNPGSIMPYTQVNSSHYWVSDVNSKYYNQFVSIKDTGSTFSTEKSEHLIDYKAYQYCLNIGYNSENKPNLGSAIFLHCFSDKPYTLGCVTVDQSIMELLLRRCKVGSKIYIDTFDSIKSACANAL
ncbi:MAG: L,D-transpeptidase family protein [Desulfovibrio sp.]|nr:L,D-transpeptidase family protein [Desulfovibrio sp.]